MLNEFPLLNGWTIGLERISKKTWEICLVSPDRKSVFSLGAHPAGFWADWTGTKKSAKEFVSRIASKLQVPEEQVRGALERVYSEIKIHPLKTERGGQEGGQPAGGGPEPNVYRCENCGHEFTFVGWPRACPKCGKTRIRKVSEDELKEREEVQRIQNDPEELREITKELVPEELTKILGLTIKHDDTNKLIHMLGMILTYTEEDQINISNRGPSSTGKSYIPIEIASLYFPKSDLRLIAYASPTAFFHDMGEWDEERKASRVDLEKKILIFLDQPHDELLHRLRPLLSHDQKELEIKITDKREKKGLRTKTVIIQGFPTVVFCTGSLRMDEQEATRSFVLSPETTAEKIREAIFMKAQRKGNPLEYAKHLESDRNRELLRKRVLLIKHSGIRHIVIEKPEEVVERFQRMFPKPKPRHARDIERVISLAKAFALLNLWNRRREGDTLFVSGGDIENAFRVYREIARCQELGIPPYLYRIFEEVIEPLYREKNNGQKGGQGEGIVGISRSEIIRRFFEVYGRPLPDWQLRQEILPALEASGLIWEDTDPLNKRRKLIFVNTAEYSECGCGVGGDTTTFSKICAPPGTTPPSNSLYSEGSQSENPSSKVTEKTPPASPMAVKDLSSEQSSSKVTYPLPLVPIRFRNGSSQETPINLAIDLVRRGQATFVSPSSVVEKLATALQIHFGHIGVLELGEEARKASVPSGTSGSWINEVKERGEIMEVSPGFYQFTKPLDPTLQPVRLKDDGPLWPVTPAEAEELIKRGLAERAVRKPNQLGRVEIVEMGEAEEVSP